MPVGEMVAGRYYVKAPQIWLDTQPALQPDLPSTELPDETQPYLCLYTCRLHIPEVYGVAKIGEGTELQDVLLLENVPIDQQGNLYAAIAQAWSGASAVRQVYWLWQLLQLWMPLLDQGVSASLLAVDNIRVEGWRIQLCQLFWDDKVLDPTEPIDQSIPSLKLADLANVWLSWVDQSKPAVMERLRLICYEMQTPEAELGAIAAQLNQLLLEQAAQLPLRLRVSSATDSGPQHDHNEDTCYPLLDSSQPGADGLTPRLAIVCDGIGGHEGGEVASQMAVRSLTLQIQAMLTEVASQTELLSPEMIGEQLEAVVRVINDLIASQNDAQGRESRRRMGTTLVMALQLPQRISLPERTLEGNSHELYLVTVGDSRAYWITQRYCHCLTLDDDVAVREVRTGRMLYREAILRPDAGALIQALGTRDSEFLRPTIQRFVIEEDGILLLCSDGLSDNHWIENSWARVMEDALKGRRSLAAVTESWIDLANQKNGHDNVSVVLMQCHVSTPLPELSLPQMEREPGSDWSESAKKLLETTPAEAQSASVPDNRRRSPLFWVALSFAGAFLVGMGALALWSQINPGSYQQFRERVLPNSSSQ